MNLLIVLFVVIVYAKCNVRDRAIFVRVGDTFEERFRGFGGLWVSQNEYVQKIVSNVGLSRPCASCYGDAYMCGWDNCKSACWSAGATCNACLVDAKCIERCNNCTRFYSSSAKSRLTAGGGASNSSSSS